MKCLSVLLLLAGAAHGEVLSVTPVQKVLDMLNNMKTKGVAAKEEEMKVYEEYEEWVDDTLTNHGFEMKTIKMRIEKLEAGIAEADACVAEKTDAVAKIDREVERMEKDQAKAEKENKRRRGRFHRIHDELTSTLDELAAAEQMLKSAHGKADAAVLLQERASRTEAGKRVLAEYQQMTPEATQEGDVLHSLANKFKDRLSKVETTEADSLAKHEETMLHIKNTLEALENDRDDNAHRKAQCAGDSAKQKGELADSNTDLADEEKLVAELRASAQQKSKAFNANQKVRQEELDAIAKATEIIASPDVAGAYSKSMFLQLRQKATRSSAAVQFLRSQARLYQSSTLSSAARIASQAPFDKVIGMITELLDKLKAEAKEEAEHKAYCDKELKDNKLVRDKKTTKVEKLQAEVQSLDAAIQKYTDEVADAIAEQASLSKAMEEATKQRNEEKAENEKTIQDSGVGAAAVKSALVVLRKFYSKQSFMQQPEGSDFKAYGGMSSAKGGVVGMMEVIQSDFEREHAETTAAEEEAAAQYDAFMKSSQEDKKLNHNIEHKRTLDQDDAEFKRQGKKEDLKGVEKLLEEANNYFDTLKPMCTTVQVSYEERVAMRNAEIDGLKKALEMLDQKE